MMIRFMIFVDHLINFCWIDNQGDAKRNDKNETTRKWRMLQIFTFAFESSRNQKRVKLHVSLFSKSWSKSTQRKSYVSIDNQNKNQKFTFAFRFEWQSSSTFAFWNLERGLVHESIHVCNCFFENPQSTILQNAKKMHFWDWTFLKEKSLIRNKKSQFFLATFSLMEHSREKKSSTSMREIQSLSEWLFTKLNGTS